MEMFQVTVEDKTLWVYTVEAESAKDAKKQVQDRIDGTDDNEVDIPYQLYDGGYSEIIGEPELVCEK